MPQLQQVETPVPAKLQTRLPVSPTGQSVTLGEQSDVMAGINAARATIQGAKTPEEKLNLISELSAASKQSMGDITQQIYDQQIAQSNVPKLTQMLKDNVENAGPGQFLANTLKYNLGIPIVTGNHLRNAIQEETNNVLKKTKAIAAQNPDLQTIDALHDPKGFLNTQTLLASKDIARNEQDALRDQNKVDATAIQDRQFQDRIKESRITSQLNLNTSSELRRQDRQAIQDEKTQAIADSITPEQRDLAATHLGKNVNDPVVDRYIMGNHKDKLLGPVLSNASSPEAIVNLALDGNSVAQGVAVDKQAQLLSGTDDRNSDKYIAAKATAKNDMKFMNRVISNPAGQEEAMNIVYGPKGTTRRKQYESSLAANALLPGKEGQAANRAARQQLAQDALFTANKNEFMNKISSWPDRTLSLIEKNPIYQQLVQDKGKDNVGVQDVVNSISAIKDKKVAATELDAFSNVMQHAAGEKNKAYFGFALDNLSTGGLVQQAVTRSLMGDVRAALVAGGQEMLKGNVQPLGIISHQAGNMMDALLGYAKQQNIGQGIKSYITGE